MIIGRILGIVAVFSLGIGVGWALFHSMNRPLTNESAAQSRALAILERKPVMQDESQSRIVLAVKKIAPAVVNIDTIGKMKPEEETTGASMYDSEVHGKGSGVILSPDGYIVTNHHVIEGASRIRVTLQNGEWRYAKLIGVDSDTDLAVIRIEATNLPVAELGDSERLQVGESTVAVGNPLGLGSTITVGVVSALNRHNLQIEEGRKLEGAIQTDASINRGNSGGALANIEGKLIGINTAILSSTSTGGSIGLGFALPTNTVRRVVHDLISRGKTGEPAPKKPWLGIAFGAVPENIGQNLGLDTYQGVIIQRVIEESPAQVAGLQPRDIILKIDDTQIGRERDLREAIQSRKVGQSVVLEVIREGSKRREKILLTIQERVEIAN